MKRQLKFLPVKQRDALNFISSFFCSFSCFSCFQMALPQQASIQLLHPLRHPLQSVKTTSRVNPQPNYQLQCYCWGSAPGQVQRSSRWPHHFECLSSPLREASLLPPISLPQSTGLLSPLLLQLVQPQATLQLSRKLQPQFPIFTLLAQQSALSPAVYFRSLAGSAYLHLIRSVQLATVLL